MDQIIPDTRTCEELVRVPSLKRLVVPFWVESNFAHEFAVVGDDKDVVVDDVEPSTLAAALPADVEAAQLAEVANPLGGRQVCDGASCYAPIRSDPSGRSVVKRSTGADRQKRRTPWSCLDLGQVASLLRTQHSHRTCPGSRDGEVYRARR